MAIKTINKPKYNPITKKWEIILNFDYGRSSTISISGEPTEEIKSDGKKVVVSGKNRADRLYNLLRLRR